MEEKIKKKYNVVFSINYEVEADEECDAIDKAEQLLVDEFDNLHCGLTEIFGVIAEEKEE